MHLELPGMNIHNTIAGKTLEAALTDGKALILRAQDGHEYRIEWLDGEPSLTAVNVRIVLPMVSVDGAASTF